MSRVSYNRRSEEMKVLYIVPGIMSKTCLGLEELERRRKILQAMARKDLLVDITDIEHGPSSIESAWEEYLSVPGTIEKAVQAEKDGYAGMILGCFGDPGIDALREMVAIPVVGPGEASLHIASMLGHRFSIVTVMEPVIPSLEKLVKVSGLDKKLASVRAVDIPVLELRQDVKKTMGRVVEEAQEAKIKDRADTVILGCMSMAFMGISDEIQESLGIPVVNPVWVSLKILEGLVSCRLSHSKKAYPFPPKKLNLMDRGEKN
jgi:allantoin racemase